MAILELGNYILNKFYPIGTIYMAWNETSPATFMGGIWVRITGGLLAASTNGTAATGSFAGNKKISINQMPSHRHNSEWPSWNGTSGADGRGFAYSGASTMNGVTTYVGGGQITGLTTLESVFGDELLSRVGVLIWHG